MKLSPREQEIIKFLCDGFSDKEIAQELSISARTVQTHVTRIVLKLDAKNRTNAVFKYIHLLDAERQNNLSPEKCGICGLYNNHIIQIEQGGQNIEKICPECFSQAMYGLVSKKVKEIVDKMD